MIKICEQCGKEYKTYAKNQRFCSQDCWSDSTQQKAELFTCTWCGEKFRAKANRRRRANKFCSVTCSNRHTTRERMKKYDKMG